MVKSPTCYRFASN